MILRLAMPALDASLLGGRMSRWLKGEGDSFAFGDVLCEVALDEFAAMRRTHRATLLSGRRRHKLRSEVELREGKVLLEVAVTSAEAGTIREVLVGEGARLSIGDTLAVVSTPAGEQLTSGDGWASSPELRCTANVVNVDDTEEGD